MKLKRKSTQRTSEHKGFKFLCLQPIISVQKCYIVVGMSDQLFVPIDYFVKLKDWYARMSIWDNFSFWFHIIFWDLSNRVDRISVNVSEMLIWYSYNVGEMSEAYFAIFWQLYSYHWIDLKNFYEITKKFISNGYPSIKLSTYVH